MAVSVSMNQSNVDLMSKENVVRLKTYLLYPEDDSIRRSV